MILLTADTGAQEWADLVNRLDANLDSDWINDNLMYDEYDGLRESYINVRDCDGDYRRVTHWTRDDASGDRSPVCNETRGDTLSCSFNGLGVNIGNGHFSSVFLCPWDDTKVIKIGLGSDCDGCIYGDGWLDYATYAMKQRHLGNNNPLLPDIYRLHINEDNGYFVALMKKYDSEWGYPTTDNDLMMQRYKAIKYRDFNGEVIKCPAYMVYMDELIQDPECPKINDLHSGNIMVYGDRLIITDPTGNPSRSLCTRVNYLMMYMGLRDYDKDVFDQFYEELKSDRHRRRVQKITLERNIGYYSMIHILPSNNNHVYFVDSQGAAQLKDVMYG